MQVFTKLQTVFVILWLADQFSRIASQTCSSDNSVYGYMLRGNIFKTLQTALPSECSQACEGDVRCQSFNYVISKNTCELNDRTKKARPADFLPSSERYYYEKSKNRGNFKHFSVTQVPYCWLLWGATNTGYKVKPPFHNKQLSLSRLKSSWVKERKQLAANTGISLWFQIFLKPRLAKLKLNLFKVSYLSQRNEKQ